MGHATLGAERPARRSPLHSLRRRRGKTWSHADSNHGPSSFAKATDDECSCRHLGRELKRGSGRTWIRTTDLLHVRQAL